MHKYIGDGFITRNYFINSEKLQEAWGKSFNSLPKEIQVWNKEIIYRAHIVTWAANQVKHLKGDFVELGVFYGHLSNVIVNYDPSILNNRKFYLVDPWGELGESAFTNPLYNYDIFDAVKKRFSSTKNIYFIRGTVPNVLIDIEVESVALLMIDMNGHEAELAALEFFYEKMVKGGIIYFDDYGGRWGKLREVVDTFILDKPETLLTFISPNAILIKQ